LGGHALNANSYGCVTYISEEAKGSKRKDSNITSFGMPALKEASRKDSNLTSFEMTAPVCRLSNLIEQKLHATTNKETLGFSKRETLMHRHFSRDTKADGCRKSILLSSVQMSIL